jgi:hypothetical protein
MINRKRYTLIYTEYAEGNVFLIIHDYNFFFCFAHVRLEEQISADLFLLNVQQKQKAHKLCDKILYFTCKK